MAYQQMASLYDRLMEDAPYDAWVTFTEEVLKKYQVKPEKIVDLGCGTGQITARLAKQRYQMIGIDNSVNMLTAAEHRASKEQLPITFIQQDLRDINGVENIDVAISYCDVMNYITDKNDLQVVFQQIEQILRPGGLLLFDIHSINHVENFYVNQTFADVQDEVSYIWFCIEGDQRGEMYHDLTFFVEMESGSYQRFEEYHHQRTYPIIVYKHLLEEAGFYNLSVYNDFSTYNTTIDEKAERIFIVAEKKSRA
ncbi:class I SAM-dependent DNA methyltransferase [Oceanobacillus halotolerans]|uniref:class I SAM-dependent DNA methyltransferase n=1 Tax=Oceanobacillus halotolerans TaxID=2663380 RepID=UPI0013DA7926|nr:class I SAM-dependent methyltransferase [Oceanobacillus halotolerans]